MKKILTSSKALVAKANLLTEQGKFERATSVYINALELDLNNHLAYHHLGICLAKQKRLAEAVSFYYYAVNLNPNFSATYCALAEVFFTQNKLEKAIACYQQSIQLNPDRPHFYMGLAKVFKARKNYLQAIGCYQRVISLKPDSFWAYFQLGGIWRQHGKYRKAIKCYTKAIEINPNFKPTYSILEFIPVEESRLDELISFYQKTVQKNPNLSQAWKNLGNALTQKKELDKAIKCYQQACYHQTIGSYPQLAQFYPKIANTKEPDFAIIGAAKCGTTSLYQYLNQHPQILSPINKEINFFNHNFDLGRDWYLAHFPPLLGNKSFITGEASPAYFNCPNVDRKIHELFPRIKIIILLRNPVDRVISHYYHGIREGVEKNSLELALNKELKLIKQATNVQLSYLGGYLGTSLYFYKLKRWLSLFPQEQVLILKSEDLDQNTSQIISQTHDFLSLPSQELLEHKHHNSGSYRLQDENLKRQLQAFFKSHNQQLETLLNRKFNWD